MTIRFIALVVVTFALHPSVDEDDRLTAQAIDRSKGAIEGTVVYQADKSRSWRYARYYVNSRQGGQLAEAVVALTDRSLRRQKRREKTKTAVIDQKDFRFDPETVAIQAGDRIKFANSDKAVHNVRTNHPWHAFNVNMQAGGKHYETFNRASGLLRPYQLGCDYHSSMRAWVFVLAHPFFQVTKPDGKFRLDSVPPGEYELGMVHPAGELRWSQKVAVASGETTKVEIRVSPQDKFSISKSRKE